MSNDSTSDNYFKSLEKGSGHLGRSFVRKSNLVRCGMSARIWEPEWKSPLLNEGDNKGVTEGIQGVLYFQE